MPSRDRVASGSTVENADIDNLTRDNNSYRESIAPSGAVPPRSENRSNRLFSRAFLDPERPLRPARRTHRLLRLPGKAFRRRSALAGTPFRSAARTARGAQTRAAPTPRTRALQGRASSSRPRPSGRRPACRGQSTMSGGGEHRGRRGPRVVGRAWRRCLRICRGGVRVPAAGWASAPPPCGSLPSRRRRNGR